jgi:phospholipase/carboxylesterase
MRRNSGTMHNYNVFEKGQPLEKASRAIILLHGRGASADDIITLADEFCDETFYIAAPQATNNTWYPYTFLSPEEKNEPWLSSAVQTVKRLIDEISEQLPAEKIYIMGFSQGACLSLEVTSRYARKYAGVAAFSGGLIGDMIRPEKYSGNFDGTKIFIGNSDVDPHIPLSRTEESKELVEKMGAEVTMKIYEGMPHTIIRDEILTVLKIMF